MKYREYSVLIIFPNSILRLRTDRIKRHDFLQYGLFNEIGSVTNFSDLRVDKTKKSRLTVVLQFGSTGRKRPL